MRKILIQRTVDIESFIPSIQVIMKDENGKNSIISSVSYKRTKYTAEQQNNIDFCNNALREKGLAEMTEQEIEYMLDPMGFSAIEAKITTTEELQQLAGFKVEKTIVYLGQHSKDEQ